MRILAISDIHNNLSSVNKLRALETNRFDVIVVAGDMGNAIAQRLLVVLATFGCPVVYVYGNWDNKLDYTAEYTAGARQLHIEPVQVGNLTFSGFSGCPTHWGKNPIALRTYEDVDARHQETVRALHEAEKDAERIEAKVNAAHDERLTELQRKTKKLESSTYHERVASLEERCERELARASRPVDLVRRSPAFRRYQKDGIASDRRILPENRSAMVKRLLDRGIDPSTLVLVTHERLGHINDYYPKTFMHLYGHVHGFRHTIWKGTHCVNVSVLDQLQLVHPRSAPWERDSDLQYANAGTYTVISIARAATKVESFGLPIDYRRWNSVGFARMDAPLIPEESDFGPHYVPFDAKENTKTPT
jgi:hypothetical protein